MKLTARKRRVAMIATGVLVAGGMAGVPAGIAHAATVCDVVYTTNDWSTGFTANVTINNVGDPLSSWSLGFAFPGNQRITQGWSANWTQAAGSNQVTATNMSYNGSIATGGSLSVGFNASYSGTNGRPTAFTINGVACNGAVNTAPTVDLTSPANNATFTAPATVNLAASATDVEGPVARVEFYRNGMLINTDTTAPYSFQQTGLPAGSYTAQARAYDSAGLFGTDEVAFTVTGTGTASVVTPPTLTVGEGTGSALTVRLSSAPTANVTVGLAVTGNTDVTVTPPSVTLTPQNWSTGGTATVNAAQDADALNDTATITASATSYTASVTTVTVQDDEGQQGGNYGAEFMELYNKIKAPASGYFSPEGIPYHSVETLLAEAPDHGHETTSEAFSYWLSLEAMYGRATQNWAPFNNAWGIMERYIIPTETQGGYNPNDPADYAPEANQPSLYPQQGGLLDATVPVGQDPLYNELTSTYGSNRMYSMHWLLDVDNTYGFGRCGDRTTRPAYINTYQRGPQESVFETVPHPSCETFNFGRTGNGGYLPLFIGDSTYTQQWRYTSAPDADARAIQAAYWALKWATEQGQASAISATITKAAQMGDYLRYAMYDKYFKNPGCASTTCPAGTGKSSSSYLLSWYSAWGGPQGSSSWAWRIGSSHNHGGYQNPFAAWALSTQSGLIPRSSTAQADWATSLTRQIQFYSWLQSADGAIAGGATNSWNGNYSARPAGVPTFYGMTYDFAPVYRDPPSNQWFGFQAWTMERVAEYYHETGNAQAKALLDKWVAWALANTTVSGANYQVPSTLSWTGQPGGSWTTGTTSVNNANLRVSIVDYTQDVGVTGAYARTLTYYAARSGSTQAAATAKGLLDALLLHKDDKGVSVPETKADYNRFDDAYNSGTGQGVYIPPGYTGTMPNGDVINSNSTFLSIRSFYQRDPDWPKVQSYLAGGPVPTFNYHRFWAQVDVAMALHDYDRLIGE